MRGAMKRLASTWLLLVLGCVWSSGSSAAAAAPQQSALDGVIAAASRAAYSLDQAEALALARQAVAIAPDESRAHRSLAATLWVEILFRRGTVTIDHYLGGATNSLLSPPKPPPALEQEFLNELRRAIDLAVAAVDLQPDDLEARYDLGAAYALEASYRASILGSTTSALFSARRAFNAQEQVLDRDPERVSAGVVVGTYRYVVAGLAMPKRMFAYLMGFGGDKERGIALLETAARGGDARVEAKLALVLIYTRERRHRDALRLLTELSVEFPKNRIFALERAAAALRADRPEEAEAVLTEGLGRFVGDDRPKILGEEALWLYRRGLARLSQDRRAPAAADLETALQRHPQPWVRGRIHLALGKLADMNGRREEALDSYLRAREISVAANDPRCTADVLRWLKQPFVLEQS
jgi:tetratricopeptide (TPR) repeat protein